MLLLLLSAVSGFLLHLLPLMLLVWVAATLLQVVVPLLEIAA
jgi:hypothetical protein